MFHEGSRTAIEIRILVQRGLRAGHDASGSPSRSKAATTSWLRSSDDMTARRSISSWPARGRRSCIWGSAQHRVHRVIAVGWDRESGSMSPACPIIMRIGQQMRAARAPPRKSRQMGLQVQPFPLGVSRRGNVPLRLARPSSAGCSDSPRRAWSLEITKARHLLQRLQARRDPGSTVHDSRQQRWLGGNQELFRRPLILVAIPLPQEKWILA